MSGVTEVQSVIGPMEHAKKNLKKWMKSKRVPSPSTILFTSGWVRPEPKGSILILSPWNYPILLCLNPLIAAIAAGNTAIIKPSEFTPASGAFLKKLIEMTFDSDEVAVVLGDQKAAIELLSHPFNHVMFTGSPSTGKLVMSAAAKHLSGVTQNWEESLLFLLMTVPTFPRPHGSWPSISLLTQDKHVLLQIISYATKARKMIWFQG